MEDIRLVHHNLDKVKKYIQNQDEHHRKKSFDEEYEEWKREYGVFDD